MNAFAGFLHQTYAVAWKEFKIMLRDAGFWGGLFLLPVFFMLILNISGLSGQGDRETRIAVINQDEGPMARSIVELLGREPGLTVAPDPGGTPADLARVESLLGRGTSDYVLALVFPPEFSRRLRSPGGAPGLVRFIVDPEVPSQRLDPIEHLVELRIMNAAEGEAAVQFARAAPPGHSLTRPVRAEEQNVPTFAVFGMFFIVQIVGGTFLREKEVGTAERLKVAPLSRSALLIGKVVPSYLVNLIQLLFIFAVGRIVYRLSFGSALPGMLVIGLATAAVANALGLLIATVARTNEQMSVLSSVTIMTLAAVGGLLVPSFEMPKLVQRLAILTPQAWAVRGLQDLLVQGHGLVGALPTIGVLLGFAAVFYGLSLLRYRAR